ncbi:MAG: hypothetical protein ACTSYA_09910 [Candidatus Kariarchaeaceae archaeon]
MKRFKKYLNRSIDEINKLQKEVYPMPIEKEMTAFEKDIAWIKRPTTLEPDRFNRDSKHFRPVRGF